MHACMLALKEAGYHPIRIAPLSKGLILIYSELVPTSSTKSALQNRAAAPRPELQYRPGSALILPSKMAVQALRYINRSTIRPWA